MDRPVVKCKNTRRNVPPSPFAISTVGEGRHQLTRVVFHGKRGELRQRYREGQEDHLGSPGLVVNAIILWNTIYMDATLNQLRAEGFDGRDEDACGASCRPKAPSSLATQATASFERLTTSHRGGTA
jgi:Tn3 transposase DDE domain